MPELTIFLDEELVERLNAEASLRGLPPEATAESVLRQYLPERVASPHNQHHGRALVALLGVPQATEREKAQQQLVGLGSRALPYLREGIRTDNWLQARGVAECLSRLESSEVVGILLEQRFLAPMEARSEIDTALRHCLQRYGMPAEESWPILESCRWPLVPLVARWLRDTLRLSYPLGSISAAEIQKRFDSSPTKADIETLVAILKSLRTGSTAVTTAQLLEFIAKTAPSLELRRALPLLRPSWRHPIVPSEFIQAVKAIEDATAQWKDLPRPVESDDSEPLDANLPRPVAPPDV